MPILRRKNSVDSLNKEKRENIIEEQKTKKEVREIPLLNLSSLNKRFEERKLKEGEFQIVVLDETLEDRKITKENSPTEMTKDIKSLVEKSKRNSAMKRNPLEIEDKHVNQKSRSRSLSPRSVLVRMDNGNEVITELKGNQNQPITINIFSDHSCSSGKSSKHNSTESDRSRTSIDLSEIKDITEGDGANLLSKGPSVVFGSLKNIAGFMPNYGIFMVSGGTLCFIVGLGVGAAVGVAAEGVGVVPGIAIGGASGLVVGMVGGLMIDTGIVITKKVIQYAKKQHALKKQNQNTAKKQPSLLHKAISSLTPKKSTL